MTVPSDESDISRCQVCGRPAQVHLTEVLGKRKTQRHFCDEHASLAIGTTAERQEVAKRIAIALRQTQNQNIEDSDDDFEDTPSVEITDPSVLSQPNATLNYSTPAPPDRLSKLRRAVHIGVLADVCLAVIFAMIIRPIQLRQPDPYNSVWGLISMVALLGGVALWAVLVVAGLILLRHGRKLSVVAYLWLTAAGIVVANSVVHMFLFPWGV